MNQTLEQRSTKIHQFANESPCICFNLRKAARSVTQVYDNMFREIGLTAGQISILFSLFSIGQMTVTELAQAMATDRTTITRNLKPLVREGLLSISVGDDKRSREITLTEKGRALGEQSFTIFQNFQEKLNHAIGADRINQLCQQMNETVHLIQKI